MLDRIEHLNAIRAFEVVARYESIARAAEELNVSHSVVSKHIKNLEAWLGVTLFIRSGNRIELSEEGRMFLPEIADAFQMIRDACDKFRGIGPQKQVTIIAEPAVAARLLRRKISDFHKENPNIKINLRASWHIPKLDDSPNSLVIHFDHLMSGQFTKTDDLFPLDSFPAVSPDFMEKMDDEADIAKLPLIHDHGHSAWRLWFEEHEPKSDAWKKGQVLSDLSLSFDAALDGEGVVLADHILCDRELSDGRLIPIDTRQTRCAWLQIGYQGKMDQVTQKAYDWFLGNLSKDKS